MPTDDNPDQTPGAAPPPIRLHVTAATVADIKTALAAGWRDMTIRPALSLFFGLVYAAFGGLLMAGFMVFDQVWILIAVGVGFPLVAPFLAAGLYEMSRRHARGEAVVTSEVLLVVFNQQRREFGWMALVFLFAFWMWAYQVRLLLALFLQHQPSQTLESLATLVFTTPEGFGFLAVGSCVGAALATALFSLTVIAMPLLMDKDIDFVTAMITSVKTVRASPVVMLGWGAVVGALSLLAIAPMFVGVIFIFPVLGHTSWHLYERLVSAD
ncbi:MAG: DUF2189 domain-containing protein [Rhodospirillaceae bacterium]|nr:DUF2189 domain-containing protein [Rhodospirillaceae bacterium]